MDVFSQKLRLFFLPIEGNDFYPYSLRREALVFYVSLALLFKLLSFPLVTMFPKTDFFAAITAGSIIQLTNQEREARGIRAAKENSTLNQAAEEKALNMVQEKYFAHTSPDGKTPWFWFLKNGYRFKYAGENLAIDFFQAEDVVGAWLTSDLHRENILNPNYQDIGVAVVSGDIEGHPSILVVQLFGARTALSVSPPPSPHTSGNVEASPSPTPPVVWAPILSSAPTPSAIPEETSRPLAPVAGTLNETVGFLVEPRLILTGLLLFILLALLLAANRPSPVPVPGQALIGGALALVAVLAVFYLPNAESFYQLQARIF